MLDGLDPADWTGDKGYIGNGMLTPIRKPEFCDFLEWERKFNTEINKIGYLIERAIANLKTWRVVEALLDACARGPGRGRGRRPGKPVPGSTRVAGRPTGRPAGPNEEGKGWTAWPACGLAAAGRPRCC